MVSENSSPSASEEPLLGAAPTLPDEQWGQLLDSVFEAPPGYADDIVDAFNAPESADETVDTDDHTIDFDAVAGGAGETGSAGATGGASDATSVDDDSLIDVDAAEEDSNAAAGTQTATANGFAAEAESGFSVDTAFTVDTAAATEDDLGFEDTGADADSEFSIDTADLDAEDLGDGLDGDTFDTGEYFV
ncbi:hypothetical protein [Gulosibacter molinativorax]|uniref:Uncharacterized protein n=1 Tax=Gulosibacter molinativorax TaxID=256821 RepID=A0ABT7C7W3_9MICO|nr:hypothetical protein [Gulosibacter molinativorax]MDJ1370844.1 hypothetical protein [Gulosibacter molinativorax]QUY62182.1 Hypotetical protein [Gulosibacter molinativorax]